MSKDKKTKDFHRSCTHREWVKTMKQTLGPDGYMSDGQWMHNNGSIKDYPDPSYNPRG